MPYAIGYQKNSPYAEMFDYYIERMRETGVLDNIKSKYRASQQQCPDLRLDNLYNIHNICSDSSSVSQEKGAISYTTLRTGQTQNNYFTFLVAESLWVL